MNNLSKDKRCSGSDSKPDPRGMKQVRNLVSGFKCGAVTD